MIVAARNFRDEEFQRPKEIWESQGAKVTIASSTLDLATGMLGARVKPDVLVKDIKANGYHTCNLPYGAPRGPQGSRVCEGEFHSNPTDGVRP